MSKSTITVKGDPKTIYNIARELRVRVTRGLVEVSGDTDKPKAEKPKGVKKEVKEEKADVETKEEKGAIEKAGDKVKSFFGKKESDESPDESSEEKSDAK